MEFLNKTINKDICPCIDCIIYSICKAKINNESWISIMSFYRIIDKCELIDEYFEKNMDINVLSSKIKILVRFFRRKRGDRYEERWITKIRKTKGK